MDFIERMNYKHDFNKASDCRVKYYDVNDKFLFEELLFANIAGVRYLIELDAFADNPRISYAVMYHHEPHDNPYKPDWCFISEKIYL